MKRSPRRRIGQSDGTAAPGRLPAKGRGHGDHGDPPDAVARAVDVHSRRIPPPPDDLDERIIALIAHEYESGAVGSVGGARASGGTARRTRRPALAMLVAVRGGSLAVDRRPLAMMLAAAVLCGLVATLMLALPGSAPQSQAAIVQIPLDEDCGSDTGDRHIIVAGVWTGVEAARFKKILERFRRETSIRVTYAYADKDRIARALDQRIARSCPPDVALLPQPGMLRDFARRGKLKPLSASTSALMERNYEPLWSRLASRKDRMYGVWLKAANKSTVWYSRRNFTAASVRPPATWRELLDVAARLHAVGIPPIAIAGADGWTLTDLFENVYLQSAGPASYDKLASGDLPWTDETVHEALRLLRPILRRQGWLAGGARALRTGFEESVAQVFAEPRAAGMVFEGDFVRTQIDHLSQHVERSDVAAFAFPSIGHRDGPVVVAGGDVAVQFTANGGARRLMRFLGTPQAAEPWARAGGFISPNRKLKLSTYRDPITRAQARALIVARTLRFDLSDLQPPAFGATAGHGMSAFFRRYLSGDTTTDALMRDLQNGARYARSCQRANVGVC